MISTQESDEAVRHLVELGYVDPAEVAARQKADHDARTETLKDAIKSLNAGNLPAAIDQLEQLVAAWPDWPAPRPWLAQACCRAGRYESARRELELLTYQGVESGPLAMLSGRVALAQRRLRDALDQLQYARCLDPSLAGLDTQLGTVLLRLGRLDEADDALGRALEADPDDAQALEGLAAISLRRGDAEQAADWALEALQRDMQRAKAHFLLGLALDRLGRAPEAIQALETCAKVDPRLAAPFRALARVATERLRDPDRASHYAQRGRDVIRGRRANRPS